MTPTTQAGALFVGADYLAGLRSCATSANGWQRLPAFSVPLYAKAHSWGEFVFDFAFAQAYERAGLAYYPKWVCAVPYTPVPGPRLGPDAAAQAEQVRTAAAAADVASVHVLFLPDGERRVLDPALWAPRSDIRFIWRDRNYGDFDGFLAALSSKKRKKLRADRRSATAHGLDIGWQAAATLTALEWERVYSLYASTYAMRGQRPYLDLACLRAWAAAFGDAMPMCLARDTDGIQAMAFFFRDAGALYGRHWGASRDFDGLHFELCYYQGIEYCLRHGLKHFDAGVQGGHRLQRGFEPVLSHSVHHFRRPEFHTAIADYLARERAEVAAQCQALWAQTAFRQDLQQQWAAEQSDDGITA